MAPDDLLVDALSTFEERTDTPAHEFASVLAGSLREARGGSLVERLLATATNDAHRAALIDFVGHVARMLAPSGERPADGAPAEVWSALVDVAHALNGSGAYALGRLGFIDEARCGLLLDEARAQLASVDGLAATRAVGAAGDALAALAVSRRLREAVSAAVGFAVSPTYDAVYEYDPPGSHVRTHVDSREYEIVFHLLLEHTASSGDDGCSVLIAHLSKEASPRRISLRAGEALVLRGRGTIHSWQPLGGDERRILTAIGFRRASQ